MSQRPYKSGKTAQTDRLRMTAPEGIHALEKIRHMISQNIYEKLKLKGFEYATMIDIYMVPTDKFGRALTRLPDGTPISGHIIEMCPPYPSAADEHGV